MNKCPITPEIWERIPYWKRKQIMILIYWELFVAAKWRKVNIRWALKVLNKG